MEFMNNHSTFFHRRKFFILISFISISLMIGLSACGEQGFNPMTLIRSLTPTPTITETPTFTATILPTDTTLPEATATELPTDSPEPSSTPTITETPTASPTLDGSVTATNTPTITPTSTRTRIPTWTPRPSSTPRPTNTPTITPTPTPPLAFFRINNIAPYSMVVSPIQPQAIASPGDDGLIYITLIGEDGRIISREGLNFRNYLGRQVGIAPEVNFVPIGAAETARLEISSIDRYNRTIALTSVEVVLLQLGNNVITRPNDLSEPYLIREPDEGDTIRGGLLYVQGLARILNVNPLIVELIDSNGNVLGREEVPVHAPSDEASHIPFEVYIPYSVSESTNVRLTVRQESDSRIPGTVSLYSYEIILAP